MSEKITKDQICEIFYNLFGFELDYHKYSTEIDLLLSNPYLDPKPLFKKILGNMLGITTE